MVDFLGSLIGGGLSYLGQRQASRDALEAAQQQAAATQAELDAIVDNR